MLASSPPSLIVNACNIFFTIKSQSRGLNLLIMSSDCPKIAVRTAPCSWNFAGDVISTVTLSSSKR